MGKGYIRPLYARGNHGLQNGVYSTSSAVSFSNYSGVWGVAKAISEEVRKIVEKGAVTEVEHQTEEGLVSGLFLVPKKDRQMRPVINLKPLNRFLVYRHFKMEGIQVVRDILYLNDWMTRIDFKDASFSIPIHQCHQKYLRFRWVKRMYQFTCLPFGLA